MSDGNEELISVIIPVYNVSRCLRRCIRSVTEQTYRRTEILLIDDGSVDDSGEICEECAEKDGRIRVYHKENGGLSSARNLGMREAKGSLFAFVDSDDCICRRMLEILYRNLCDGEADISVGRYWRVAEGDDLPESETGGEPVCRSSEEALTLLLGRDAVYNTGVVCNKLFRRKVFDGIKFPEGRLHEDEFVIHYLLGNAGKIAYTSDILYYYFVRKESITGSYTKRRLDALDAYEDRFLYYRKRDLTELALAGYRRYLYIVRVNYFAYKRQYPRDAEGIRSVRERHAQKVEGMPRTAPMRLFDGSPTLYRLFDIALKLCKGREFIWE